jgi:hypothetical protein
MTTGLCTSCGDAVVIAENGRVLTTTPHPLGVFDPTDGEPLTRQQVVQRVRDTGLAGHAPHRCPVGQGALFETQEAG